MQTRNNSDCYPTRLGKSEKILPRHDPVVYKNTATGLPFAGPLNGRQLEAYEGNGFLVLPNLMPQIVGNLLDEINSLRTKLQGTDRLVLEPDSDVVRTIFDPFGHSELVQTFFQHPDILGVAEQLLGSKTCMIQSRINVKPAFTGRSFDWHSDFETWHSEDGMPRMRALTAWIMLSDCTEHNGPLYVIPGSHKEFISCAGTTREDNYRTSLRKQTVGVPTKSTMESVLNRRHIESITGTAGTVVFHECNLLHGSPDNISSDSRTVLMGVFNSVENAVTEPFGGTRPRPEFLCNRKAKPLHRMDMGLEIER